ncbi:hypothetical protein MASR2M79_05000 [Aminivibrio sp.]
MAKAYGQMEGEEVSEAVLGPFIRIGEKMAAGMICAAFLLLRRP